MLKYKLFIHFVPTDFKKMLQTADRNSNIDFKVNVPTLSKRLSAPDLEDYQISKQKDNKKMHKKDRSKFNTISKGKSLLKMMGGLLPKNHSLSSMDGSTENLNRSDDSLYSGNRMSTMSQSSLSPGMGTHLSASNPDLTQLDDTMKEMPDLVVKVFKSDQSYKFLPIHKVNIYSRQTD